MTRKIQVNIDSLAEFLKATHADMLTVNVALHNTNEKVRTRAIKVHLNRLERVSHVIRSLELGETILMSAVTGEGE